VNKELENHPLLGKVAAEVTPAGIALGKVIEVRCRQSETKVTLAQAGGSAFTADLQNLIFSLDEMLTELGDFYLRLERL